MPIYSYKCECGKTFEKFFPTISVAEPFVDGHECECGKQATRNMENQNVKAFFKFADAPVYSSNFDPEKD